MNINKNILFIIMILISFNSHAISDGSGPAILIQMTKQVSMMRDQVKSVKESLKISKTLKAIEEAKSVKKNIHHQTTDLDELLRETKDLKSEFGDLKNDPFSTEQYNDEVRWYKDLTKDAKNKNDLSKARAYSAILMELNRVKIVSENHKKTKKIMREGTNVEDDAKITANNTLLMTDLLIRKEERTVSKEKSTSETALELFNSTSGFKHLGK